MVRWKNTKFLHLGGSDLETAADQKVIRQEVVVKAPLDFAWFAWIRGERVAIWFAPETVIDPKIGGAYELYFIPGNKTGMNTSGCKITKLEEKKELSFTWKGPDPFADLMNNENSLTEVQVHFEELGPEQTKVIVKHRGFQQDGAWTEAFEWHNNAWAGVLGSLKSALETGQGDLCCQPD